MRKYEITDFTIQYGRHTLHRIQAVKDIPGVAKKGDLGGFIESEINLFQSGRCWVFPGAMVMSDARVCENATIDGTSIVTGESYVKGDSMVCGNSFVDGETVVSGNSVIADSQITGGSIIYKSSISDANLCDVTIFDGWIDAKHRYIDINIGTDHASFYRDRNGHCIIRRNGAESIFTVRNKTFGEIYDFIMKEVSECHTN